MVHHCFPGSSSLKLIVLVIGCLGFCTVHVVSADTQIFPRATLQLSGSGEEIPLQQANMPVAAGQRLTVLNPSALEGHSLENVILIRNDGGAETLLATRTTSTFTFTFDNSASDAGTTQEFHITASYQDSKQTKSVFQVNNVALDSDSAGWYIASAGESCDEVCSASSAFRCLLEPLNSVQTLDHFNYISTNLRNGVVDCSKRKVRSKNNVVGPAFKTPGRCFLPNKYEPSCERRGSGKFQSFCCCANDPAQCPISNSPLTTTPAPTTPTTPAPTTPAPTTPAPTTPAPTTPAPTTPAPTTPAPTTPAPTTPAPTTPAQTTPTTADPQGFSCPIGSRDDKEDVIIPFVARPAHKETVRDPTFNSDIVRVTPEGGCNIKRVPYNTVDACNKDATLCIFYHTKTSHSTLPCDAGLWLYNMTTMDPIKKLPRGNDIYVYWSADNNEEIFIEQGLDLKKFNVFTEETTIVRNFQSTCGSTAGRLIRYAGHLSSDRDTWCWRCGFATSANPRDITFCYSMKEDRILIDPIPIGSDTDYYAFQSLHSSITGNYVHLSGRSFTRDGQFVVNLDMAKPTEHNCPGSSSRGDDYLFMVNFGASPNGCDGGKAAGIGTLVRYDLSNGKCKNLVSQDNGYSYPQTGVHMCSLIPDYTVVSVTGYPQFTTGTLKGPALSNELFLVNSSEDNPKVCRLLHTRTMARGGRLGFWGEAHPVLVQRPNGSMFILFNSDWYDEGATTNVYKVELQFSS